MYKSQITHIQDIEARNKAFNALSKQDKRKEIALDCFMLVSKGIVKPSNGCYWSGELDSIQTKNAKTFQLELVNNLPQCEVCARGGMMLSQIRLGNSISSKNKSRYFGDEKILKGFSYVSFRAMEKEYEESEYSHPYGYNTREKLQNICLNVLHNGDFNTDDKTDYLKDFLTTEIK